MTATHPIVTVDFETVDETDPDSVLPIIFFRIHFGQIRVSIVYSDIGVIPLSNWQGFLEAVQDGSSDIVEFCDANGHVYIETDESRVTFCCGKSGAGGDGEIEVSVPATACIGALTSVIAKLSPILGADEEATGINP